MKFSCGFLFSVDYSYWIDRKILMGDRCEESDCWVLKLKFPGFSSRLLNESDLWLKDMSNIKLQVLAVAVLFILQTSGLEIGQTVLFYSVAPLFLCSEAGEILLGIRIILPFTFQSMPSIQRFNNG